MNTKTTLFLAVVFLGLVVGYLLVRSGGAETEQAVEEPPPRFTAGPTSSVERILVERETLADPVKIVCRKKGEDQDWVFERDSASSREWRMTSPLEAKIVSWEADKFDHQLLRADYEMSYGIDDADGMSLAQAGLDDPEATVTVTDENGASVTIAIGKPASATECYVRLADKDEVCVIALKLSNLLKDRVLEYRDSQLWNFKPNDATRIEIVEGTEAEATYVFSRDGAQWMMKSPVNTRASEKVPEALRTFSRLRTMNWVDDREDSLGVYGLDPPIRTVRVTVVEATEEDETDAEDDEAGRDEDAGPPATVETVYELHLSDRSPIGEDTKVYLRVGDEPLVGTLSRTQADTFTSAPGKWRDMKLTTANVKSASRIHAITEAGEVELLKKDGAWSFTDGSGPAESGSVDALLSAMADLEATAFLDGVDDPPGPEFGLAAPRADIRLTLPGMEGPERITVGAYTDQNLKRLVYVRRNESASVGKVRVQDVDALVRGPRAYRDRGVFNLSKKKIRELTLRRENRFGEGEETFTFHPEDAGWQMSAPREAEVQSDLVDKLVAQLAGLRADSIVGEADDLSAYGLDAPSATITLRYTPPVTYRLEPAPEEEEPSAQEIEDDGETSEETSADDAVESTRLVPVEVQPPDETYELLVSEHNGKSYAKRPDRGMIYEVAGSLAEQLLAEFRPTQVGSFDDEAVRTLSIRQGERTFVFERGDDGWYYAEEPDWPIDSGKVNDLLLRIRDLRTEHYVAYNVENPALFGLDTPEHEIVVTFEDGAEQVLWVSQEACRKDRSKGRYAVLKGQSDVFLLTPSSIARFEVSLDDLEAD